MKARIKKTGDILTINEYARISFEYGNDKRTFEVEEVELVPDDTSKKEKRKRFDYLGVDLVKTRNDAAIAALHAIISNPRKIFTKKEAAAEAVRYADELIESLKYEK